MKTFNLGSFDTSRLCREEISFKKTVIFNGLFFVP